jgi:agmatine deiminase
MIKELTRSEKIRLLVRDADDLSSFRRAARRSKIPLARVFAQIVPTGDAWIRDYGPLFLRHRNGEKALTKWVFNAWGKKYSGHLGDNDVFGPGSPLGRVRHAFYPPMVFEGGSIDVNGLGDCLVTEQCLLNPNRNPGFSKKRIERMLRDYLGVRRVLWLAGGIAGDDTDGHVDDVARFTDPRTIVAAWEESKEEENYEVLQKNWRRLLRARTARGMSLRLVKLPMPKAVRIKGKRLPASYANFYIANRSVLLPVFDDPADAQAAAILKPLFPGRRIVPISARSLVRGLGAIHCVTQQEPQ